MNISELYLALKKPQEERGFFFNTNERLVKGVLEGLLTNKERYGYMACPCRLADGEYEKDRDILCPCAYREDDVRDYGSCYCGLYVSDEFNKGKRGDVVVPERRPPEMMDY